MLLRPQIISPCSSHWGYRRMVPCFVPFPAPSCNYVFWFENEDHLQQRKICRCNVIKNANRPAESTWRECWEHGEDYWQLQHMQGANWFEKVRVKRCEIRKCLHNGWFPFSGSSQIPACRASLQYPSHARVTYLHIEEKTKLEKT